MSGHVSYTITVQKRDGSEATHTAEAVDHKAVADGAISVCAMCCEDGLTASWHTFYGISTMSEADIQAEIQGHVQRVATHHASLERAMDLIPLLLKPKGVKAGL